MEILAIAVITIPLSIAAAIADAFLVQCAWNWLLVPLFGLHVIALGKAFALKVVLYVARGNASVQSTPANAAYFRTYAIWYGLALLFMYIARHFV